jgi:Replication-relaxation
VQAEPALAALPARACESFRELVEMDLAQSVRSGAHVAAPRALEPDGLDLDVLALVARLGHVLTSQLHRHFNPGRAVTTTQRRLKRLSDAALVDRFQFHRRDGGGVPMCYVITPAGREVLATRGRFLDGDEGQAPAAATESIARGRASGASAERRLRDARRDVHAAGWALALVAAVGRSRATIRAAGDACALAPQPPAGAARFAPADLRLPGGRAAHDFFTTNASGERVEVERFETIRPHVVVEVSSGARRLDVIAEFDDRAPQGPAARKLERYEHFLAGWALHTRRYGPRAEATPIVVFVCRSRSRARLSAEAADVALRACRAYAGEYPREWQYPARERMRFVAERDIHEGLLGAYGVLPLPPHVRASSHGGDPRTLASRAVSCFLFDSETSAAASDVSV